LKTLENFPMNMNRLRERFGAEEGDEQALEAEHSGGGGEGITAEEQRRLYRFSEYATSQFTRGNS
jgi:hypothetical protein